MGNEHGGVGVAEMARRIAALSRHAQREEFTSAHWTASSAEIVKSAAQQDPEAFLRWSDVMLDMAEHDCFLRWRRALSLSDNPRWTRLSRCSPVGRPHTLSVDDGASPISVQHAYHLMLFEALTAVKLTECDVVVEFGGGHGNFCRMLRQDGYRGPYVIFDLPTVREVQREFLSQNGITVVDRVELVDGATLLTEQDIEPLLSALRGARVAFVSTWALSETPLVLRRRLFPALHAQCTRHLIASQWHQWPIGDMHMKPGDRVDNPAYFLDEFMPQAATGLAWVQCAVPYHTTSHYLFAAR